MTLQYEAAPMLECVDERVVSPLEFELLEEASALAEVSVSTGVVDAEAGWKAQIEALEAKLEAVIETATRDVEIARHEAEMRTREDLRSEMEQQVAAKRTEVVRLMEQFDRERKQYFAAVESEVVSLALAIAERLLHREATLDPMLLRGVVHVVLSKVEGESRVTLRVPEGQAEEWREIFAGERSDVVVSVMSDGQLVTGDAVLETAVGRVQMGVRDQLKEIERGFFDLLEKRPS